MPTVIVIDNEAHQVRYLGNLLQAAFPDWTVLPEKEHREGDPMSDWEKVARYLLRIKDEDVVLCLDLGLGDQDFPDIDRGIQKAGELRDDRPNWTFVAFSKFLSYAALSKNFKDIFDGALEKSDLAREPTRESAVARVRSVIEDARGRRGTSGFKVLPAGVSCVDSLGMRLFRAAFADSTIADLVRREAPDWTGIRIESLTSGYSGAYMLHITSRPPGHSLILKVARDQATIGQEIQAQEKYLAELAPFCSRLVTIDPSLHRFIDGSGFYYRQMPVDGVNALQYCSQRPFPESKHVLERIGKLCLRVLNATPAPDRPLAHARDNYELSPVDVGRIETSTEFLSEIGGALAASGIWPSAIPPASEIATEIRQTALNWTTAELTDIRLPQAVQHGDLNPGNIMVNQDEEPALIDFQRLRPWPLGYDLARLAGLLRVRLTDVRDRADWLPFRFSVWCEPIVAQSGSAGMSEGVCPEAEFFDRLFLDWTAVLNEPLRQTVEYGYGLGSLWDGMKILSYTDVSPIKRCWVLLRCWSRVQELKRTRALMA